MQCLLFLYAWIPAGGNECHVQYRFITQPDGWWYCRRHMENMNIINAHTHRFSDVNILISCAGNVLYCLLCSIYCMLSTQMILKWNENWQNWWLINTITSLEWNPVCWQPWKKTSTLQPLLKMHHTKAGEHRECYMDRRFSSGSCGGADINGVIHRPSCIKTQPASSSSLQLNIPRDQHTSLCLASSTDHNIANYWLLTAEHT